MSTVVVDSSVLLAMILRQPEAERVEADLARWARADRRIHVPDHFWLEVVNALTRRHGFTGAQVLEAIHDLDTIDLETVALDRALLLSTNDLVERYRLTAYDAGYLALARALGASFATFDHELRVAGADILDPAYVDGTERQSRLSEDRAPYGSARQQSGRSPGRSGRAPARTSGRSGAGRSRTRRRPAPVGANLWV